MRFLANQKDAFLELTKKSAHLFFHGKQKRKNGNFRSWNVLTGKGENTKKNRKTSNVRQIQSQKCWKIKYGKYGKSTNVGKC